MLCRAGIQRDPKWMDTAPISVGVLLEQAAEEEKPGRLATHLMSGRLSMAEAQVRLIRERIKTRFACISPMESGKHGRRLADACCFTQASAENRQK